ncbi:MAG: mechanosensitive ion channel [Bacteroidetes bacterium]|nr:mechanosensitive ion channel [Bacteroidota bacterium]
MNEWSGLQLSEYTLILVLLIGVLLFLGMAAARYVWSAVFANSRYSRILRRAGPSIEAVIWLVYFIRSTRLLLDDPLYYHLVLAAVSTVLVLLISWYVVRDWISGIVLKAQNAYEIGREIIAGDIRGKIRNLNYLSIKIERENGEELLIPYSRLVGRIHGMSPPEDSANHHRFEVRLARPAKPGSDIRKLRAAILNSVWSFPQREPQIRQISESEESSVYEVIVYSPGAEFSRAIEEDVQLSLGGCVTSVTLTGSGTDPSLPACD